MKQLNQRVKVQAVTSAGLITIASCSFAKAESYFTKWAAENQEANVLAKIVTGKDGVLLNYVSSTPEWASEEALELVKAKQEQLDKERQEIEAQIESLTRQKLELEELAA